MRIDAMPEPAPLIANDATAARVAFVHRHNRPATGESIDTQLAFQHFRWWQYHSMHWVIEAVRCGSLAVMAGKFYPLDGEKTRRLLPWGLGAETQVRLLRDLPPAAPPNNGLELRAGQTFTWHTTSDCPEIQAHCPVDTFRHGLFETIPMPWDALALDLPPLEFLDDEDRAEFDALAAPEHVTALASMIDALMELLDVLDQPPDSAELGPSGGDTFDVCLCANAMRGIAMNLYSAIHVPQPPADRQRLIDVLREQLALCDFPCILTRRRYEGREHLGRDLRRRQSHFGYAVPFWIGDDNEKSAITPQYPWILAIRPALDRALTAYRAWEPMFFAAVVPPTPH